MFTMNEEEEEKYDEHLLTVFSFLAFNFMSAIFCLAFCASLLALGWFCFCNLLMV